MAQEFAKKFYKSAEWQRLRTWYIRSVFGLCEKCGNPGKILHHKVFLTPYNITDPSVSLNPDNLIYLCKDCHELTHHSRFDASGRPLPPQVWKDDGTW